MLEIRYNSVWIVGGVAWWWCDQSRGGVWNHLLLPPDFLQNPLIFYLNLFKSMFLLYFAPRLSELVFWRERKILFQGGGTIPAAQKWYPQLPSWWSLIIDQRRVVGACCCCRQSEYSRYLGSYDGCRPSGISFNRHHHHHDYHHHRHQTLNVDGKSLTEEWIDVLAVTASFLCNLVAILGARWRS